MYASSRNKHFFTKSCHRQTYQNYEQPCQTYQNLYFQSHFSVVKIGGIFLKKKFYEKYLTGRPTFNKTFFQFLLARFIILVSLALTRFSEKMLISTGYIHGFMSNLIKKSWTDSNVGGMRGQTKKPACSLGHVLIR